MYEGMWPYLGVEKTKMLRPLFGHDQSSRDGATYIQEPKFGESGGSQEIGRRNLC